MSKRSSLLAEIQMLEKRYMKKSKHTKEYYKIMKATKVKELVIPAGASKKKTEEVYKKIEKSLEPLQKKIAEKKQELKELPLEEDLDTEATLDMLSKIRAPSSIRTGRHFKVREGPGSARRRFKAHMKEIFEKRQQQYREDMAKLRKEKKVAVAYA